MSQKLKKLLHIALATTQNVPSPCLSVCVMDELKGLCKGCYRTRDEIASWMYDSDETKHAVWQAIEQRMQRL